MLNFFLVLGRLEWQIIVWLRWWNRRDVYNTNNITNTKTISCAIADDDDDDHNDDDDDHDDDDDDHDDEDDDHDDDEDDDHDDDHNDDDHNEEDADNDENNFVMVLPVEWCLQHLRRMTRVMR